MKRTQTLSATAKIVGSKDRVVAYRKDPDHIPAWTGGVVNGHGVALKYSTGFDDTPPDFNAGRIPAGSVDATELYVDSDVARRRKGLEL